MGNSRSSIATAKLIFLDGGIQVFSSPVKVSHVLEQNPTCFVCNSDDMEFDDFLSAVDVDEELQMGQLYFALPSSWLEQPLQAEHMADLAVKASLGLRKNGGGGDEVKCGCCGRQSRVADQDGDALMFYGERYITSRTRVTSFDGKRGGFVEETIGRGRGVNFLPEARRGRGGGGKVLKFARKLSTILED